MSDIIYLSKQGYEDLKDELHKLKTVDRPHVINQIAEARDKGDLSENAEYDAAKEAQGLLEARIAKLEADLSNSRIIDESKLDNSKVSLLSNVTIKNIVNNSENKFVVTDIIKHISDNFEKSLLPYINIVCSNINSRDNGIKIKSIFSRNIINKIVSIFLRLKLKNS